MAALAALAALTGLAALAAGAVAGPHIRICIKGPLAQGKRDLLLAFNDEGALQLHQLVDGQPLLRWASAADPDKAWRAGAAIIVALVSPKYPYGPGVWRAEQGDPEGRMGPTLRPSDSPTLNLSLHYRSADEEPVYSVSLPIGAGAGPGVYTHITRMFRLLCISTPGAPFNGGDRSEDNSS